MAAELPIEPGRYIDFNGLPVEGGRLKRLTANWAFAATAALVGVNIVTNNDKMYLVTLKGVFSLVGAWAMRKFADHGVHDPFFPGCVIDTKPDPGQKTSAAHLVRIESYKRGPLNACLAGSVILPISNGSGIGVVAQMGQTYYVWNKIDKGAYVIVSRDDMKRRAPEAQKTLSLAMGSAQG